MEQLLLNPIIKQVEEGDLLLAMIYLRSYKKRFHLSVDFNSYYLVAQEALMALKGKGKISLKTLTRQSSPTHQYQWIKVSSDEGVKPLTIDQVRDLVRLYEVEMQNWDQGRWFWSLERIIQDPYKLLNDVEQFQLLKRWFEKRTQGCQSFYQLVEDKQFEEVKRQMPAKFFWLRTRGISDIEAPILQSPTGEFETLDQKFLTYWLNELRPIQAKTNEG